MAKIVLVHGAFNELWGPHELEARWVPALRDGLWHHRVDVDDGDVAVCFYGDLFRRRPGTQAEERLAQSRAGIADALEEMVGEDALEALQQAAGKAVFDRTVDMVAVMATDPNLRTELRARIEAVVDDGTRVLAAHSFGTVLSYMALCNHPQWRIDTFVTMGSPLAHPMIFGSLDPAPVDGRGVWPGAVRRWVNVRAVGDKAAEVPLDTRFGADVEDVVIDNGHRAHAPEPYLNASETGRAIADALRA
jgi:pimeloyl-ACP methyl ester carboxylesterase